MLHTLHINHFTLFPETQLEFSKGLNIILGDNGTGKTLLLKLGYTLDYVLQQAMQEYWQTGTPPTKAEWASVWAKKFKNVFKPEKLSHLCRSSSQATEITVTPWLAGQSAPALTTTLSFSSRRKDKVGISKFPAWNSAQPSSSLTLPLFLPVQEVLSCYPGFLTHSEDRELDVEEVFYDLCKALSRTPLRGKRLAEVAEWVTPLEKLIPGQLVMESQRFYLKSQQQKREMALVAEGLRKLATLNYLITNGSLVKGSTLFWDAPETNLNATAQVKLVDTLVQLANAGVQIVLAVHDLFLLKELALRVDGQETRAKFFELWRIAAGENWEEEEEMGIRVVQGDSLDDCRMVAVDAALDQYDREQEVFMRN